MEVSGQLHAPGALPPGTEFAVPVGYEVEWSSETFWTRWGREIFIALSGNRIPVVHTVT
jgi:hypothetical protein